MIKKEKVLDKRKALLNATLELINTNGFHETSMSKISKYAAVAPATIYLYFENKQDLINQLYLDVKASFSVSAFKGYTENLPVKKGFEIIWYNIANYKLKHIKEATFLSQCDNAPLIDAEIMKEGLKHLQPLLSLWERGKTEGIIKPLSPYVLYAYTVYSLSFLMSMQERNLFEIDKNIKDDMFKVAWDGMKL